MRKILVGTAVALFGLAPAMTWADCEFHNAQAMASSKPAATAEVAKATPANKAAPAVAKAPVAKQGKQIAGKATSPSKDEESTVVAKTN